DEAGAAADLQPRRAQQLLGGVPLAGAEEDRVAGGGADPGGEALLLGVGEVLRDGPAERPVLLDEDVREAARAAGPGPVLPAVQLPAGLGRAARHDDRADVRGLEHPERG